MQSWVLAVIAAIAALIAYLQWVTAHQKIVLELFDKRYEAFVNVVRTLMPALAYGGITNNEFSDFVSVVERCRFLFGEDIYSYLIEIKGDLAWLSAFTDDVINQDAERGKLIEKKYDILNRIGDFEKTAVPKFMPYIRLDQKMKYFWPLNLKEIGVNRSKLK